VPICTNVAKTCSETPYLVVVKNVILRAYFRPKFLAFYQIGAADNYDGIELRHVKEINTKF